MRSEVSSQLQDGDRVALEDEDGAVAGRPSPGLLVNLSLIFWNASNDDDDGQVLLSTFPQEGLESWRKESQYSKSI